MRKMMGKAYKGKRKIYILGKIYKWMPQIMAALA